MPAQITSILLFVVSSNITNEEWMLRKDGYMFRVCVLVLVSEYYDSPLNIYYKKAKT